MKHYLPTDKEVYILGRTAKQNPLPLFWTASGVEIRTKCSEVWFDIESDYVIREEWIRIEVDGCCMQRMMLPKGRSKICAFRAWPSEVEHTVRLLKEVQPMREDESKCLLLHGIECDGTLVIVPPKKYKFEFIGDSLSSGEGLGGFAGLVCAGSSMFGVEGHYALKTAKHFDADFRILSQSGWGVYCSCYNDLDRVMPKYYEQVCGVLTGERNGWLGAFARHDFQTWQPDVIIINLGSNDGFALDREGWINPENGQEYRQVTDIHGGIEKESALHFEAAVARFLQKLRALNPKAYLLWTYGMCDHTMMPYLQRAVAQYKEDTGDVKVDFQPLPATIERWLGSSNHPGVIAHGYAADVLIDKLKGILE